MIEDHPIAAIFPLINDAEAEELADSIERSGQREDIVLHGGKILDGRNRYRACEARGITPQTRQFDPKKDGDSALRFVIDCNLNRRQLSKSQRAVIAAKAIGALQAEAEAKIKKQADAEQAEPADEPTAEIQPDGTLMEDGVEQAEPEAEKAPTLQESADAAGVSKRTMSTATKLAKDAPEEADKVQAGKKTLHAATTAAETKKLGADKKRKAIKDRVRKVCGDGFADAFLENTVLKTAKELAAFLELDDDKMAQVAGLVATGWKVKRAAAHVGKEITNETTVADLVNRAIAAGDSFVHAHHGWEIAITKID